MSVSIFSTKLIERTTDFIRSQIDHVKMIVNDVSRDTTVEKIDVLDGNKIQIYIKVAGLSLDDVLNGIEVYDSNDVLLVKDQINLQYNIQEVTYLYEIDVYTDYVMTSFSTLN